MIVAIAQTTRNYCIQLKKRKTKSSHERRRTVFNNNTERVNHMRGNNKSAASSAFPDIVLLLQKPKSIFISVQLIIMIVPPDHPDMSPCYLDLFFFARTNITHSDGTCESWER